MAPQSKPARLSSATNQTTKVTKPQSAKPKKTVPKVDPKQLDEVFLELKLKLQVKGFHSN